MTVKQLIGKLKKLPEDAVVTIYNNEMFLDGEYVATSVFFRKDANTAMIDTNYEKRLSKEHISQK